VLLGFSASVVVLTALGSTVLVAAAEAPAAAGVVVFGFTASLVAAVAATRADRCAPSSPTMSDVR
jgi:hypothetical protein